MEITSENIEEVVNQIENLIDDIAASPRPEVTLFRLQEHLNSAIENLLLNLRSHVDGSSDIIDKIQDDIDAALGSKKDDDGNGCGPRSLQEQVQEIRHLRSPLMNYQLQELSKSLR